MRKWTTGASLGRGVISTGSAPVTVLISIGALIVLGLLPLVSPLALWLPSNLVEALDVLMRGAGSDLGGRLL